jgi:hypothetical protein
MDTLPTIQKPRSGGAAVLRQHQASVITTTAIGHITDTNSPVVDSDAITDLQVGAGFALNLTSLLLLHQPQRCCFNSTTSTRPRLIDETVASAQVVDKNLDVMGFHLHLLLRANTRKHSTINHLQFTCHFIDSDRLAAARDRSDLQICRLGLLTAQIASATDEMHVVLLLL